MAEKLDWVTVGDEESCDDCIRRDGTTGTMAQWAARGVPGSGFSVCRSNCRCLLVAAGKTPVQGPIKLNDEVRSQWETPELSKWWKDAQAEGRRQIAAGRAGGITNWDSSAWLSKNGVIDPKKVPPNLRPSLWRATASALRAGD